MWRYLAVLFVGLFLTLQIAGKDEGQMRQGLLQEPIHKPLGAPAPKAVAETAPAAKAEADVAMATFVPVAAPAAAPEPAPAPEPEPVPVAVTPDAPLPSLSLAFEEPATDILAPAPARASNVFSIADTPPANPDAALPVAEPVAATAPAAAPAGILWVSANSINVREGPGTDYGVAGRLSRGESVTVVGDAGDGWLRIRIEGDGLEGFVASRLLVATPP
jgi:hypothetical protein